jgi:hypothetical protein
MSKNSLPRVACHASPVAIKLYLCSEKLWWVIQRVSPAASPLPPDVLDTQRRGVLRSKKVTPETRTKAAEKLCRAMFPEERLATRLASEERCLSKAGSKQQRPDDEGEGAAALVDRHVSKIALWLMLRMALGRPRPTYQQLSDKLTEWGFSCPKLKIRQAFLAAWEHTGNGSRTEVGWQKVMAKSLRSTAKKGHQDEMPVDLLRTMLEEAHERGGALPPRAWSPCEVVHFCRTGEGPMNYVGHPKEDPPLGKCAGPSWRKISLATSTIKKRFSAAIPKKGKKMFGSTKVIHRRPELCDDEVKPELPVEVMPRF